MDNINLMLGIIASLLSIISIVCSKKTSDKNKAIENYLKKELNITLDLSEKDMFSVKKAKSGRNGNSIIGNNNNLNGGK